LARSERRLSGSAKERKKCCGSARRAAVSIPDHRIERVGSQHPLKPAIEIHFTAVRDPMGRSASQLSELERQ
jgi:hypothetical protein